MAWKGKAVCSVLDLCACDQARMLESGAVSFLLPSWLVVQGSPSSSCWLGDQVNWERSSFQRDSCTRSSASLRSSFMGDATYKAHSVRATPARSCAGGRLGGSLSSTRSRLKVWGQALSSVLWFRSTFRIQIWVQNISGWIQLGSCTKNWNWRRELEGIIFFGLKACWLASNSHSAQDQYNGRLMGMRGVRSITFESSYYFNFWWQRIQTNIPPTPVSLYSYKNLYLAETIICFPEVYRFSRVLISGLRMIHT